MKKCILLVFSTLVALAITTTVFAADAKSFSVTPSTNNGQKWKIGYLEGGPYQNYPLVLRAVITNLMDLGWVNKATVPVFSDYEDTSEMWKWLSKKAKSNFIEFVDDAYWSSDWDDDKRVTVKKDVLQRLKKKDLDLMLAMGTWGGQDLANDQHSVAIIVLSSTDPLKAGIVKSIDDSGYDHLHARLDPTRHERQVLLFHDIMGFSKLGVAFEDTVAGRSIAAISDVEKVAKERNFEVVSCFSKDDNVSQQEADDSVVKCFEQLAPKVDAIFVTIQRGVNLKNIQNLTKILEKHKIPTFSQGSSEEVKHGFLLSIAQAGFKYVGAFHAETIAKVFNGAKPRELEQVFEDPPKIAFNLASAQLIGYDPPIDIIGAADEIYQDIEVAK